MSMNEHDKFILNSIIHSIDYISLGQEIRCMELTLLNEYFISKDPIYELILSLMEKYTDDEELGYYIYKIKNKLYQYFTS